MKKFVSCALVAFALVLNAEAKDKDKEKYSVPDNGNTALLLGTAVFVLGIATRRFATR